MKVSWKKIFSKKPKDYIHYLVLTAILFLYFYVGDFSINLSTRSPIFIFIFWFIGIAFGDQIIRYNIGGK